MPDTERRYCRNSIGSVWAVELLDGRVVRGAGPIDAREAVPDILPYLDYDGRSRCVESCPDAATCPYAMPSRRSQQHGAIAHRIATSRARDMTRANSGV